MDEKKINIVSRIFDDEFDIGLFVNEFLKGEIIDIIVHITPKNKKDDRKHVGVLSMDLKNGDIKIDFDKLNKINSEYQEILLKSTKDALVSSGWVFLNAQIGHEPHKKIKKMKAWFKEKEETLEFSKFYEEVMSHTLIPDTNILMYHILPNYIFKKFKKTDIRNLNIFIPKSVLFEIENKLKSKSNNPDVRRKKGSFKDILLLKSIGKCVIGKPSKEINLHQGDLSIREEIKEKINESKENFLFLTMDSFNCLMSESEGIKTCFLKKEIGQDKINFLTITEFKQLDDKIGSILCELSEEFEEITLFDKKGRIIIIKGDWIGKEPHHWAEGSVMVSIEDKDKDGAVKITKRIEGYPNKYHKHRKQANLHSIDIKHK